MTSTHALQNRMKKLEAKFPKQDDDNIFTCPEWPPIRTLILETLELYPDAKIAILEAIAPLEKLSYCPFLTMREAIFHTIEVYADARLAVARALLKLAESQDNSGLPYLRKRQA